MKPRPEGLVELTTVANEAEAGMIIGVLADAGIEAWSYSAPGVGLGAFGSLSLAPTVVAVRGGDVDEARAVLDRNREDSVDLDWSEVDVGEPEDADAAMIAGRDQPERAGAVSGIASWFPVIPLVIWLVVASAMSILAVLAGPKVAFGVAGGVVALAVIDITRRIVKARRRVRRQ